MEHFGLRSDRALFFSGTLTAKEFRYELNGLYFWGLEIFMPGIFGGLKFLGFTI